MFFPKLTAPFIALALVLCGSFSYGDTDSHGDTEASESEVSIGIEGHYRVGRWVGVRFSGTGSVDSIETRDGDGVEVQYLQENPVTDNKWGYAIPGSEAAPLVLSEGDRDVMTTRFPIVRPPSLGPAMIPLGMPWLVVLGDPLGVDQIGANELLDREALIAVSKPAHASGFPDSVLGYDGVDMMLIGGSSADLLESLSQPQEQAIEQWLTGGGRVFLTLGESSKKLLAAAPWLRSLLRFDDSDVINLDPSAIETYTSTQTPLADFRGIQLPKDRGRILIMGRTTRRESVPIAAEYNVGFGRVTVIAADLDEETFAQWPERLDLITRLTGTILIPQQEESAQKNRATAYDDLAGQMRSTLDQFEIKRSFGFSIVSLIVMALIAAIGPLDYLLINRFLGRPLLGWLSFPIVVIGLSVVLAFQARPAIQSNPATVPNRVNQVGSGHGDTTNQVDGNGVANGDGVAEGDRLWCNRIEIVDIDSTLHLGRGFQVSYLYTHNASLFDLVVTESESSKRMSDKSEQFLTTPFGYPGEAFGGIQIAIEDSRLPRYQVPLRRTPMDSAAASGNPASSDAGNTSIGDPGTLSSWIKGMPLASRSSKGITTRWRFTTDLPHDVTMRRRSGSELLQGSLVNPLPFDILDGVLIYRNWAYLLPTRFPSGEQIPRVDSLRQKNFRWRLSRQEALQSSTETEAWDPTSNDSIDRVIEMLMFHDAVGGSRYTGLRHEPLAFLDLSHLLTDERCILVGRVANEFTTIEDRRSENSRQTVGRSLTMVRVVLPVIIPSNR